MNKKLTNENLCSMLVSNKEQKLLELLREVSYGQVVIYLEEGELVRVEKIKESIKL